jgi:drug/metabolite transporter (DMT)-like permease
MEHSNRHQRTTAVLLAVGGVIFFSAKAIFVKKAYQYQIDTVSLLLIRMMISFPVYFIIGIISSLKAGRQAIPKGKHILQVILLGFTGYYLASYFDFAGLHYISASLERIILFAYPTMVVLITAVVNRKRIPQRQLFAILITYFGIFLAFFQNISFSKELNAMKGGVLIIVCAFTYACYLVGSGKLIPVFGSVRFTAFAMMAACLMVAAHYSLIPHKPILGFPTEVYWIGTGMAVISTILPSFMISEAIRRIGASHVAIIGSIGPFSTILLAAIFLGERISAVEGLGAIIVISGVLLVNTESKSIDTNAANDKRLAA